MENLKEFWVELEAQVGFPTTTGTNDKAGGTNAATIQRSFPKSQNSLQIAMQSAYAKVLINVHCELIYSKCEKKLCDLCA